MEHKRWERVPRDFGAKQAGRGTQGASIKYDPSQDLIRKVSRTLQFVNLMGGGRGVLLSPFDISVSFVR